MVHRRMARCREWAGVTILLSLPFTTLTPFVRGAMIGPPLPHFCRWTPSFTEGDHFPASFHAPLSEAAYPQGKLLSSRRSSCTTLLSIILLMFFYFTLFLLIRCWTHPIHYQWVSIYSHFRSNTFIQWIRFKGRLRDFFTLKVLLYWNGSFCVTRLWISHPMTFQLIIVYISPSALV